MVADFERIDVFRLFMADGHQEDADAFQVVGGDTAVDAVLVAAAGGQDEGGDEERAEQGSFHGLTVACTRSSEKTARYTPRVSNATLRRVKSGTLKEYRVF